MWWQREAGLGAYTKAGRPGGGQGSLRPELPGLESWDWRADSLKPPVVSEGWASSDSALRPGVSSELRQTPPISEGRGAEPFAFCPPRPPPPRGRRDL